MTIIYAIVAAMGFAIGVSAVNFAMISEYFSIKIFGTASGLINAISGVGLMLGPLIGGSIATTTGSFFQLTAVVAVVLAVVSLALRQPTKLKNVEYASAEESSGTLNTTELIGKTNI